MAERIALKGKLDLTAASHVHGLIAARRGSDVEIDLGAVSQIGALCLQVLISAAKTATAHNTAFSITGCATRVRDQMAAMGVPPENLTIGDP